MKKRILPIVLFLAIACAGCSGNMENVPEQEKTTVTTEAPPIEVEVQADAVEEPTETEPELPSVDAIEETTESEPELPFVEVVEESKEPEPELPLVDVQEEATQPESELPLADAIICIDPGHSTSPRIGQGDTVLVSPLTSDVKPAHTAGTQSATLTEEKLNLMVGLLLKEKLEELGATVVMTREESAVTVGLIERCKIASEHHADVEISLHADGHSDPSAHGLSVLVPGGNLLGTPSIVEESVRLGEIMVDTICEETEAYNRGTISRSDLTGFNFSEIPIVLVEMGFMTNPTEGALLETADYQDKLAEGMVKSLLSWYAVEDE